eukprot:3997262-Lingulodinium_polyedra.AAC.1
MSRWSRSVTSVVRANSASLVGYVPLLPKGEAHDLAGIAWVCKGTESETRKAILADSIDDPEPAICFVAFQHPVTRRADGYLVSHLHALNFNSGRKVPTVNSGVVKGVFVHCCCEPANAFARTMANGVE